MTRDEARAYFAVKCGLSYSDVTISDLRALHALLNEQFARCRIEVIKGNRYDYWRRVNDAKFYKGHFTQAGKMVEAYLTGKGAYFSAREVISFNADGFIGFCGDSDDQNAAPVLSAFTTWCDWLVERKRRR